MNSGITLETLSEINNSIKEFLTYHGMDSTLGFFDEEIRSKQMARRLKGDMKINGEEPILHKLYRSTDRKSKLEASLEKELSELRRTHLAVIQGARQIFAVSINFLQSLNSIRDVAASETAMDLFESYKVQLGKYHRVVTSDKPLEEAIPETVMAEHKSKLVRFSKDKNNDALIEVLLSLRVNALQIAPELRKNLVYELIRNDVLLTEPSGDLSIVTNWLSSSSNSLKHASISMISVISSTLRGVEYITKSGKNLSLLRAVIKLLKLSETSSVTQRFAIATLQKCSVKESLIPTMMEANMIEWVISLLGSTNSKKTHIFVLDFSSALLANIVHSSNSQSFYEANQIIAKKVLEDLLSLIRSSLPVSVLMHVLIAISYFSKDSFSKILEELKFVERISRFVEKYSQIDTTDNEALEIDKKTVLDLCAHMFHPKDVSVNRSDDGEGGELTTEDRIREYENEQGELIFECFQDEVS